MRKSRLVLVALLAIASACTVEENYQTRELKEKELTIEARREGDEVQTRTYRRDTDGSVWWVPGDAISLFYGNGTNGGSKFTSAGTDTAKVTNFTGTITAITGGGEYTADDTYFWGLYPYQEDASCDGTAVTMTLPKEQTAVPGTFATETFPSIGHSQGLIMGFYNICGGMKFSVTKEGVKRVTLKSNNGEFITGKAKICFNNGTPAVAILDGSDEIALEAPSGEYFMPEKFYFMTMFPTTFKNGFTITLETDTKEATVEKTNSITCKRSFFGKIEKLDESATYTLKADYIPFADDNVKAILIECGVDGNGDGEISYAEAASVTSFDEICSKVGTFTSFDEFQYFTSVTSLPSFAFRRWYGLKTITIPESMESIERMSFQNNCLESFQGKFASEDGHCLIVDGVLVATALSGVTSYTVPQGVTTIGSDSFYRSINYNSNKERVYYSTLEEVILPEGLEVIESCAFEGNPLKTVTIPESVTRIEYLAFEYCPITAFYGKGATDDHLGVVIDGTFCAFAAGSDAESFIVPEGVTRTVSGVVFYAENLKHITYPSTLVYYSEFAFYCKNLEDITILAPYSNFKGCSRIWSFFGYTNDCPIYVPEESLDDYKTNFESVANRFLPIPNDGGNEGTGEENW